MGKKDAQRAHMTPVDQYRKNIGKHDYKRTKKDVRKIKSEAEIRKSSTTLRVSADITMPPAGVRCTTPNLPKGPLLATNSGGLYRG